MSAGPADPLRSVAATEPASAPGVDPGDAAATIALEDGPLLPRTGQRRGPRVRAFERAAAPTGPARPHLVLVGPTAVGKSAVAMALARRMGGIEIISADSMQVYRGMDIGTAKPSVAERAEVAHHLLDVVDPIESFAVGEYQRLAHARLAEIEARGNIALLVGGSGLYVQAVVDGWTIPGRWPEVRERLDAEADTAALYRRLVALDPEAAARIEPMNRRRIVRALEVTVGSGRRFSSFGPGLGAYPRSDRFRIVGLRLPRAVLDERIGARYREQVAAGFLTEVRALHARAGGLSATAAQALGYRELLAHVRGEIGLEEALAAAYRRTCQFARRQERWFRRDPRAHWYDAEKNPVALAATILGDWT